jgi:hypothetical protein
VLLKDAIPVRCSIALTANPLFAPTLKKTNGRAEAPWSSFGIVRVSHADEGQLLLCATSSEKAFGWH